MYDPDWEPQEREIETEGKTRNWPVKGMACLLLVVMLCGVISTPLAIFLYWNNSRQERPLPTAAPVESAETTAGSEEGVNRIVYITPQLQLATIAPDGSDQRLLTDADLLFQFPAWSPDNSRVAAIGSEENSVGVYVAPDLPAGELQTLYKSDEEAPFYLYWSPDSRQVSFLANHPSGLALHIGDVLAETSRILATGSPFYWDWTPGGDRILIHSGFSGEDSRLALLDPSGDGGGDNISDPGFFQAPGVSPNGRLWAYAQVDGDDNGQLTIFDAETGQQTRTEPHQGLVAMSWNPVSDVLAYITPGIEAPVFYGPLHLLDAATGESQIIADELVIAFFWSPDGRYIAYFTVADTESDAVQAGLPGKNEELSKPGSQEDELIMEVWLADTLGGSIRRLRAFEPTDLFVFQFLPFFDQYSLSHRIWSPDSSALVLPIVEDGAPRISILPIDGRAPEVLVDGIIGFWSQ
jgi:Tol biopolymer transport system component